MSSHKEAMTSAVDALIDSEKQSQTFIDVVKAQEPEEDSHLTPPIILTSDEEARLYRKIDMRLMPILSLIQIFSFMDRGV